jgi:NAD(P)-dependent dehydrogenase (short-subunit alcohol dehydrogenase family)
MRRVLVLGGSGHVGQAVVRGLARGGDRVAFTYQQGEAVAAALPGLALRCDLALPGAVAALFAALDAAGFMADDLVHCAAAHAVRVQAGALIDAAAALSQRPAGRPRNLVAFTGLAPGQSFPIAPHLAAAQGALSAAVMALAHALGPQGLLVNGVALGLLDGGAAQAVSAAQAAEYTRFSALRRVGRAEEAAATALWFIHHNTALSGKVLPANGGL